MIVHKSIAVQLKEIARFVSAEQIQKERSVPIAKKDELLVVPSNRYMRNDSRSHKAPLPSHGVFYYAKNII